MSQTMDGEYSDSSSYQRPSSLAWKNRSAQQAESSHDNPPPLPPSRLSYSQSRSVEKKRGESRRTIKRMQEEVKDGSGGVAQAAPTTDITALMDNYFFFNAAHAAAANRAGLFSREKQHVSEHGNSRPDGINLYRDNEELERRFVRTLEWVGEASKVISPSSLGSRESNDSRYSRASINSTTNNKFQEIMSNEGSELSKAANIGNLNNSRNNMNASISRGTVREVPRSMDAFISREDFEGGSFQPPPGAISQGEVHATSFRVPQKPPSRVINNGSSYGDLSIPSFRPKEQGPSATCELPSQSCGSVPITDYQGENVQVYNNPGYDNHSYMNVEKLYSKPNSAMVLYDRNDRLARSAYHANVQRRAPPNENENPSRAHKFTNTHREAKKDVTNKETQQQKEKVMAMKAPDKALKEAPANKAGPAVKVQQWFSRLIGIGPKQENAKASKSTSKAPPKATTERSPLSSDYELVIHGATMHDVLSNKVDVAVHSKASKPETQPQLKQPLPQAGPPLPKSRSTSTNTRAYQAVIPASKPSAIAPIMTRHDEEQRGPSKRFADDAHSQRFGYGSRSERWIPHHDQHRQSKEYYEQDQQRMMQAIKSARSSLGKPDQQQENFVRPVVASSKPNVNGIAHTAVLVNQERMNQKYFMDEVEGRDPARLRRSPDIEWEAMPRAVGKGNQEAVYSQSSRALQINTKQYVKEPNVKNDKRDATIGRNEHNPRAFVSSYASQSERFSRRHHVQTEYESSRKLTDVRGGPDDVFTRKGTHPIKGNVMEADETIVQPAPPPPPEDDRDIEVLNNFLLLKKANLHLCSHDSRLHFILSNSSLSSMIAAICYAWVLHNSKMNQLDGWERVPVMSITRNNMWNYKQLAWLFEQAGLDTHSVIFMDEVDLNAVSNLAGEYRISAIGQDIVRLRDEVASYCTLVAEAFFKEIETSKQAKCIRILLLAGLLIDTENLDSTTVPCTRRDEMAASFLLPGAGHKGRAVLLAELKQVDANKGFYNIMCEKYGDKPSNGMVRSLENTSDYLKQKTLQLNEISASSKNQSDKEDATSYTNSEHHHQDVYFEDNLSIARSKSSKSYSSVSTNSTDQGKSRSSSTSPPLAHRA